MWLMLDVMLTGFPIALLDGVTMPLHEDVGMKLFILSFDDDDLDWFTKLKDNRLKLTRN
jgi:hypothetical protein